MGVLSRGSVDCLPFIRLQAQEISPPKEPRRFSLSPWYAAPTGGDQRQANLCERNRQLSTDKLALVLTVRSCSSSHHQDSAAAVETCTLMCAALGISGLEHEVLAGQPGELMYSNVGNT